VPTLPEPPPGADPVVAWQELAEHPVRGQVIVPPDADSPDVPKESEPLALDPSAELPDRLPPRGGGEPVAP